MDRPNANFRQLLPTQLPTPPVSTGPQLGTPLSGRQIALQKRSLTTAACHRCRQGKAKCDGARPICGRCIHKGFDCTYDRAPNETPALALKREHDALKDRYDQVKAANDALIQVFEMLRLRPADDTTTILNLIKDGSDPGDIIKHISDGDLLLQMNLRPETRTRFEFPWRTEMPKYLQASKNPYLGTTIYAPSPGLIGRPTHEATSPGYFRPSSAAKIVDPRLDAVRPSLYTNICKNDKLMRQLLHDFFLHGYDWCHGFNRDDFLDDMLAERHDFCSRLLVNCVLAYACHCCVGLPDRAQFWNPRGLGYRFFAEARRLYEIEVSGKPSLLTLQASTVMYCLYLMSGVDKFATIFRRNSMQLSDQLGLMARDIPGEAYRYKRSRVVTVWFLFWIEAIMAWHYGTATAVAQPPAVHLPDPDKEPDFYSQIWLQYPMEQTLQPMNHGWYFKVAMAYGLVVFRFSLKARGDGREPTPELVQELAAGLRFWYQNLPDVFQPQNLVLPLQYKAHLLWMQTAIEVQSLLSAHGLPPVDMLSSNLHNTDPATVADTMQAAYETLARIYYLRHGFDCPDSFSPQFLSIIAFGAIKKLAIAAQDPTHFSPYDLEDIRSTLLFAAKGLYDQGRNWYISRVILDVVRNAMKQEDIGLLEQHGHVKIEDTEDVVQARAEFQAMQYPLDLAVDRTVETRRLGEALLEREEAQRR